MKIFKILLILALGLQIGLFGDEGESGSGQTNQEENPFNGAKDDSYVTGGACSWQCRSVGAGYRTQIVGFNYDTGTTLCNVYRLTDSEPLSQFNANKTNEACAFKMDKKQRMIISIFLLLKWTTNEAPFDMIVLNRNLECLNF